MKLVFPSAVLNQHVIALGKTGSGKSSVIRYIIEGVAGESGSVNPTCILDVKGDWWGLKYSATGRGAGVDLVIFGGLHADIPIRPNAGTAVGEIVATSAFTCIVDISEMSMGERTRFVVDFFGTLFRKTRGQRILVLDECHNFVPQGKVLDPLSGQMLHWGNRLASEGRGKGITIIAASQRPQKVHKDFLTSCETLIAMRVIHKLDRKAVADWLDGAPDQEAAKQVLADLANVKRGTGWTWSPEIGFGPKLIEFPRFKTYDSFAPQAEGVQLMKNVGDAAQLQTLREQFKAFIEAAEANDPVMLKKRIADLEEQLEHRQKLAHPDDMVSQEDVKVAADRAYEQGRQEGYNVGLKAAWDEIGRRVSKATPLMEKVGEAYGEAAEALRSVDNRVQELAVVLEEMEDIASSPPESHITEYPASLPPRNGADYAAMGRRYTAALEGSARALRPKQEKIAADIMNSHFRKDLAQAMDGALDVRQRKLLTVLAQHQGKPLSKAQINALAGYRSSGKVSTAYAELARNGWMGERAIGFFHITDAGLKALGDYEPLPTGRRLLKHLLEGNRLDVREKGILRVVANNQGQPIAKKYILEELNYSSSGKISTAFSRLQKLGYVKPAGIGALALAPELM